ncbi:MAG: MFS transporter [Clostridia bacterium]|nr:MFS transporter [Clostridia bacterium]
MKTALNKNYNKLIFIGIFLYFALMFSKQIFNAEIIEIQEVFGATATNTSLVMLVYYVTYAISQFLLVLFIDKIKLRYFLFITLFISSILTILIGVVGNMGAGLPFLFVVFALNGVLQVANYAGLMRIFSKYLNREKYMLAMKFFNIAATVSLASSYAISSLFVALSRWDMPFIISGLIFLISVLVFFFGYKPVVRKIKELGHVEQNSKQKPEKKTTVLSIKTKRSVTVFIVLICLIAVLSNYLYYGLNNWFSKLLYDVYGIPKHYSILVSVGVSVLTAVAGTIAISYYSKTKNGNFVTTIGYLGLGATSIALAFTYDLNVIYVILVCVLFICFAQAFKTLYNAVVTYEVKEVVDPGKYSLMFNAMASIAAGCSPTIMSLMFENFGWKFSFMSLAIASVSLALVFVLVKIAQKNMMHGYFDDNHLINEGEI